MSLRDRHGTVFVRGLREPPLKEDFAGDLPHREQDPLVANAAAGNLDVDHRVAKEAGPLGPFALLGRAHDLFAPGVNDRETRKTRALTVCSLDRSLDSVPARIGIWPNR